VRVPRTKQPSLRWARFRCRDGGTPLLSSPSWLLAAGRPSASPNFLFGAPRLLGAGIRGSSPENKTAQLTLGSILLSGWRDSPSLVAFLAPRCGPPLCLAQLPVWRPSISSGPAFGVRVPRTKQPSLRWARFRCRDGGTRTRGLLV